MSYQPKADIIALEPIYYFDKRYHRICWPCRSIKYEDRPRVRLADDKPGWCCHCRDGVEETDELGVFIEGTCEEFRCADLHEKPYDVDEGVDSPEAAR